MNKPENSQSTTSEQVVHERCPCREIVDTVREYLGISPAARQHLASSRVEFLKAVREILNDRIEHLSSQGQKGTKVAVE
jgi:vacuolar-type H+-ATPase subunit E/Vma4